jgi:hypothetical protein
MAVIALMVVAVLVVLGLGPVELGVLLDVIAEGGAVGCT